jgi:alpha-2-macroglobulin
LVRAPFPSPPPPHAWTPPALSPAAEALWADVNPAGLQQFRAKVAAAAATAASSADVPMRLATRWDSERYPASPDLVVIETQRAPEPGSRIRVTLDGALPSPEGPATPGRDQAQAVPLDPPFFVAGARCAAECNPSRYNDIELTADARLEQLRRAVSVVDLTGDRRMPIEPARDASPRERWDYPDRRFTLEDLRYEPQPPVSTYLVRLDGSLEAEDGQQLGYDWVGTIETWHDVAFTSFGDGHGVWEREGGLTLPFFARNLQDVRQWVAALAPATLMTRIRDLTGTGFRTVPPGDGQLRRLTVEPDVVQSHGLDLTPALGDRPTGLVWAALEDGAPIPRARRIWDARDGEPMRRSTIVQVTNLGITVKDSPQNTLVFVTRLDTGEPVPDATVSIVRPGDEVFWRGATDADGVAIAPDTPLRDPRRFWELSFIVLAEKDGDLAYVGSNWTEGLSSWEFGIRSDLHEAAPQLRGSVFTDRGVYRLGEEVHVKAILRRDSAGGIALLPAGTPVHVSVRDARNREIDARTITAGEWSSADWTFTLPGAGALGTYWLRAQLAPADPRSDTPGFTADGEPMTSVTGSFLVAAYRRPDFRVDATLTGGPAPLAGETLRGAVSARYLFGAALAQGAVRWRVTREPVTTAPPGVLDRYVPAQWAFVGYDPRDEERGWRVEELQSDQGVADADGALSRDVATARDAGRPYRYTFEAEVEDVSRQRIAGRAGEIVHPAPWYIGVRRPPYFVDQRAGLQTAVVAVRPDGMVAPGVPVTVTLTQVQWNSVRRAEGGGFYRWETERRLVDAGTWTVTSGADPVPLAIPLPNGGSFILTARAEDGEGRSTVTATSFYALGDGYTAWTRYDHNRIDLVPERATWRPGDTARIMVQSPWESATALVTTEREGIRSHRRFALTSTQQTIEVPIADADIPNVYVSVLLVKGRTLADTPDDGSDPGRPAFRVGYVELQVEDASKRLAVEVSANRQEYRPANSARIDVRLTDAAGGPATGEVTLWAVDYGVLSLTGFQTPDVLRSVYVPKALQVSTADSRQRLVSRRAIVPKGSDAGGAGGSAAGAGTLRRDFRVLAFWIGSTVTNADGRASIEVTLPESLTTYRIMAVGADRASRFGWGESEIRISKPVTLQPAFPRFLAVGDRAFFGSVVTNGLGEAGQAEMTIRSLDPDVLRIDGETRQLGQIGAGAAVEMRFTAVAQSVGRARVQMSVTLNGESDAYEEVIPVSILVSPETVAVHGQTDERDRHTLSLPAGVVPGFGGLQVELSSSALTGLANGMRYLLEYPYECAEQKASRTLANLLTADLGDAFSLTGVAPADARRQAEATLRELRDFQCPSGGFGFWRGSCASASAYLTSYLLHVFHVAARLGYPVDAGMLERAYDYLEQELAAQLPASEAAWPAALAWQAFAAKVLTDGGRTQDSTVNRLLPHLDRMPVFALAHLYETIAGRPGRDAQQTELMRRIRNAIAEEGGSAHVEELHDPYLMWFWNSNVRSTAITLGTLVRQTPADAGRIRPMVQWLMRARRESGAWGNTQENAWALEALVDYYRRFESVVPNFRATAALGADTLVQQDFTGRIATGTASEVPMADLARRMPAGSERVLQFEKGGEGTLFYNARLRYAADRLFQDGLDAGLAIARTYAPLEPADGTPRTTFNAGDLVRVTIRLSLTAERRYVAVTDPLPAGFEAVESWFATTASDLARAQSEQNLPRGGNGVRWWWERGGFDHVERHDDRVVLFATRLGEGVHEFSYIARATTSGTFRTAPAHAEQMYEPEVFGRTATATIEVRR